MRGTDPLTGRRLRYRQTAKTERQAQIVLGKLLEQAAAGAPPDSGVTVAEQAIKIRKEDRAKRADGIQRES